MTTETGIAEVKSGKKLSARVASILGALRGHRTMIFTGFSLVVIIVLIFYLAVREMIEPLRLILENWYGISAMVSILAGSAQFDKIAEAIKIVASRSAQAPNKV